MPVCCGGVVVSPGDVLVASEEGIAVVPLRSVPAVAQALLASTAAHGDPDALRKVFALAQAMDCDQEGAP